MTHAELKERQGWTLQQKIDHSLEVIETFVSRMGGLDKVYVSLSGGKDGQFSDSDKKCAEKAGFYYMDIEDFIQCDDFLND